MKMDSAEHSMDPAFIYFIFFVANSPDWKREFSAVLQAKIKCDENEINFRNTSLRATTN